MQYCVLQATVTDFRPPDSLIEFLLSRATYPMFRGRPTKARKVLELGKCYYWRQNHISEMPLELKEWAEAQGVGQCNSVLVNIYEETTNYIGWHCDTTRVLADGKVTSFSFALRPQDREKVLAVMEFKGLAPLDLVDGSRVEFDAIEHERDGIQHRVRKTLCPRLNFTFRCLK